MKSNLLIFLVTFLSAQFLFAQGTPTKYLVDVSTLPSYGMDTMEFIPLGIPVGDAAPNFKAFDQHGAEVHLSEQLKEGPVVLVFYRGHWCGYCNEHLKELENSLMQLSKYGAKVISVTPESNIGVKKTIDKTAISFSVISDSSGDIQHLYDVAFQVTDKYNQKLKSKNIDLAAAHQRDEVELPVPATYIIGQDGNIRFSHFDPNFRKRLEVNRIIEVLQEM